MFSSIFIYSFLMNRGPDIYPYSNTVNGIRKKAPRNSCVSLKYSRLLIQTWLGCMSVSILFSFLVYSNPHICRKLLIMFLSASMLADLSLISLKCVLLKISWISNSNLSPSKLVYNLRKRFLSLIYLNISI